MFNPVSSRVLDHMFKPACAALPCLAFGLTAADRNLEQLFSFFMDNFSVIDQVALPPASPKPIKTWVSWSKLIEAMCIARLAGDVT